MYNTVILIFSILSGIGACFACYISYFIYKRQKNIALFELRMRILSELEVFIYFEVSNWDWNGDMSIFKRFPKEEINALFDESFRKTYELIYEKTKHICRLRGDEIVALRHDSCNGLSLEEIQDKIYYESEELAELYTEAKQRVIIEVVKI